MDLKDIKAIIDLMKKNAISEFELERQDFKIKLKRGLNGGSRLTGATVVSDLFTDTLIGAGGQDWFWRTAVGVVDILKDRKAGEVVN